MRISPSRRLFKERWRRDRLRLGMVDLYMALATPAPMLLILRKSKLL